MIPANWKELAELERRKMTVCIAATCELNSVDPKIIMCTDWQVMSHLGSAETGHKQIVLHTNGWYCLYSGYPHAARALISGLRMAMGRPGVFDTENTVLAAVRAALNEYKKALCDEYTNGKFGMSYDDFLKNGKSWLPADRHSLAVQKIENTVLGADCLIVGFVSGFPLLIETDQYCGAVIRESFATIGEGGHLAHSSLMHRAHDEMCDLPTALYNVYEAKKWAQRNRTVGDETALTVLHLKTKAETLTLDGKKYLDTQFSAYGPKAVNQQIKLPDKSFVPLAGLEDLKALRPDLFPKD